MPIIPQWNWKNSLDSSASGLPRWRSRKESACQCGRHRRCRFDPGDGKIPWRRRWQPTTVFSSGKSHGQRSLAGYSPWGYKELDMTECTHTHTQSLPSIRRKWKQFLMCTLPGKTASTHFSLAKMFVLVFLYAVPEDPAQPYWPTQHIDWKNCFRCLLWQNGPCTVIGIMTLKFFI